jgi:hypothetical protein
MDARGIRALAKTSPRSQRQALMTLFSQHILLNNPRLSVTLNASAQGGESLHNTFVDPGGKLVQGGIDIHSPLQSSHLRVTKRGENSGRHSKVAERRAASAIESPPLPVGVTDPKNWRGMVPLRSANVYHSDRDTRSELDRVRRCRRLS